VLKEGLDRYLPEIKLYTQSIPQFIEMEHEQFYVVHDKVAWYSDNPFTMIEWWFELYRKHNKSIPSIHNLASVMPNPIVWRKNLRSHVDLEIIGKKSCVGVESILIYDPHYRRKMEEGWMKAKNAQNNISSHNFRDSDRDQLTKEQKEYLDKMYGHSTKRYINEIYGGSEQSDDDDDDGGVDESSDTYHYCSDGDDIIVRPAFENVKKTNTRPDPPKKNPKKDYVPINQIQREAQKILQQVAQQDVMDEYGDDDDIGFYDDNDDDVDK
jgi:hypothetical protein